jgi:hypothetical protein
MYVFVRGGVAVVDLMVLLVILSQAGALVVLEVVGAQGSVTYFLQHVYQIEYL